MKIVAWLQGTQLAAGFHLLDQTEPVHSLIAAQARVVDAQEPAPPLGQYRTFRCRSPLFWPTPACTQPNWTPPTC